MDVLKETNVAEEFIPPGDKSNAFVVMEVDTESGVKDVPDDCGTWDWRSATTVNQTFAIEGPGGKLRNVFLKKEQYTIKKVVNGQLHYVPLSPQPESVITFHRYYTKLAQNTEFSKRVTTVIDMPDEMREKRRFAVVEYRGQMPMNTNPHGRAKNDIPYKRTHPKVLRMAADMASKESVSTVFSQLEEDLNHASPNNSRQISDQIYRKKKKENDEKCISRLNIADDVLCVISELHTNQYVQEIVLTKGKKPVVIVYSDQIMTDMKRNCMGDDASVLGVDRTFNLGRYFVTIFSYTNRCVLSRRTNDYPIMFGPCMIHFDAEEATYSKFFSHVADRLGNGPITIGSDEEISMTNALKSKFLITPFLCPVMGG